MLNPYYVLIELVDSVPMDSYTMETIIMKLGNLKLTTLVLVLSMPIMATSVYASHELENQSIAPEVASDGHISWHEFRHELNGYPSINAIIDNQGQVTLSGHLETAYESNIISNLASKIRGASKIINLIDVD